jgi:hypothetical protein
VALRASQSGVRSRQRVMGIERVIEGDGGPVCGGVASGASGGEAGSRVIRIVRSREVRPMAAIAGGWQGCEVVIDMALQTWDSGMRAGQREVRVIEGRSHPSAGGVAHGAVRGEAGSHVVRIPGPVEVGLVACVAGCGCGIVMIVYMALRARHACVLACQGIVSKKRVIE